jgi:ferric-dicitrate binding protein FerR (iron transport regulator)
MMVWRRPPDPDPHNDPAAPDVIAAYDAAVSARSSTQECYRAAVEAWRRAHPDHAAAYASKQAVEVVLAAKGKAMLRPD